MAELGYLASALVTGAFLVAVWTLVARMENWRSYDPRAGESTHGTSDRLNSTAAWTAGFFVLVLVMGGSAVLLVSDAALAASVGSWTTLAAMFGVLLVGFVLWGTYSSARHHGYHSARAVLLSAWVFGALFVGAITVKLLLAG